MKKVEQTGCIQPGDPAQVPFPSGQASQVFAITKAGRERFSQLMLDTASHPGTYQRLFRIKALHLEYLSPKDQLYLVDHYLSSCQTGMRSLRAEAHDLATTPLKVATASAFFLAAALDVMEVGAQEWELEWAWAQRIRERILSRTQEHDQDKREETHAYFFPKHQQTFLKVLVIGEMMVKGPFCYPKLAGQGLDRKSFGSRFFKKS